jgi:hypothetical protein
LALSAFAALFCAAFPLVSTATAQTLAVTTQPALYPSFDPGVTDYVTRCTPGNPVGVTVSTEPGTEADVDGEGPRSGDFTSSVSLNAGQSFRIVATAGPATSTYYVRCLPSDFPSWSTVRNGTPQASFYVTTPSVSGGAGYVSFFDTNGVPLWWMNSPPAPVDATFLPDGNVAWSHFPQANPDGFEEHDLDGTFVRQVHAVSNGYTDPHDLQMLSNGDYLLAALAPRVADQTPCGGSSSGTINDIVLQEVSPEGAVVWSWDTADHIPLSEVPAMWWDQCRAGDPYHYNAVESVGQDQVLISYRHLNAIYKVDVTTGEVVWKLGGLPTAKSLTIVGDPNDGFTGQHDIRSLGDGTITLHDNETRTANTPRAVRYAIDEQAKTATLVEAQTNSTIASSPCCGSARRLPGGNWVIFWGGTPTVTEQTPGGNTVFRLNGATSYRAQPVTNGLSATALRDGMDAQYPRGFTRPKWAGMMRIPLVPAYRECLAPNSTHGAPLSYDSCSPPAGASDFLTVGTPDANGMQVNSAGTVVYKAHMGDSSTPANDADVRVGVSLTDVRQKSDLSDYTGQLRAISSVRITDRLNGPLQNEAATGLDTEIPLTVPCTATASDTIGASCSLSSSFNAIVPGAVVERKRTIWGLGQIKIFDGGSSGTVGASDATLFETEGLFVP